MTCRQCGTEIADKALICYRCGTATAEIAPPAARAARPRGNQLLAVVTLVVLILAALFMGQASELRVPPAASYATAAVAALVLVWRVWSRRRRP